MRPLRRLISPWMRKACNGRPAKLLKIQRFVFHVRTENHGVGGSIPPLGTNTRNLGISSSAYERWDTHHY
jgi:hypothetical protein